MAGIECPFCGREYDEAAAQKACGTCSLFGGCKKLKCPHCGYEVPAEPRMVKWFKERILRRHAEAKR